MSETTLEDLASRISSGSKLAIPVDYGGVSMAMTQPILQAGISNLDLVCVPTGGLQADILIGAGRVRSLETSAITLGEAGGAPCFSRAIKSSTLKMKDSTCPAIHAGLLAAQKGAPFQPIRGLIGSDVLRNRPDWKLIQNPFSVEHDEIVVVPPICPDVSLFHAPLADRKGNVWVGRRKELAAMAYASKSTIVTVEKITDQDLFAEEEMTAGIIPSLYVDGVACARKGALPYGLWGQYPTEIDDIKRYAALAKSPEGFAQYLDEAFAQKVFA
jgi:glutaconate CoA-transferase subunit A